MTFLSKHLRTLHDVTQCCSMHALATDFKLLDQDQFNLDTFNGYEHFIDQLVFGQAEEGDLKLTTLPGDIFTRFRHLVTINIADQLISELPVGLVECRSIKSLTLSGNPLSKLPDGFSACVKSLEHFDMSSTLFTKIPTAIFGAVNLTVLLANDTALTHLSRSVGELTKLEVLSLCATGLTSLPDELAQCRKLNQLNVSGIPWIRKTLLSLENLHEFYDDYRVTTTISRQVLF